ncbi:hypothetical protein IQ07DRAFT_636480 [Pyrenochaeta sp. DS3sAY3a]|nr:hypothetical protein IQ07DRAFT_636480 [Pyrenochaeta sp. DS3sAY3a]
MWVRACPSLPPYFRPLLLPLTSAVNGSTQPIDMCRLTDDDHNRAGIRPATAKTLFLKPGVDLVAIHDIFEDEVQTWTDFSTKFFWLRDLLPQMLGDCRILTYGYKSETLLSPGIDSTKFILNHVHNLVAELYADRQLTYGLERPIIFICYGFGGLLVKKALAYSHSCIGKGV